MKPRRQRADLYPGYDSGYIVGYRDEVPPPTLQAGVTDPHVIGRILGPDGRVIAEVRDRRQQPFGFVKPSRST
jgi:hypothetical protein